jgi:hypothetical protein
MKEFTLDELRLKLDQVPCRPRLYPTRLYALQLITGKDIAAIMDEKIIQMLITITHFNKSFHYEFTHETISPNSPYAKGAQKSWVEQFIGDLIVFGLREAILYFHSYEFEADPSELIQNSVSLYHELAKLYLKKRREIEASKDDSVRRLVLITKLSGEGQPQHLASP